MRLQRLFIPVLFALLLLVAYVVAAQTDENLPDPYQTVSPDVMEPGALVVETGTLPAITENIAASPVCEAP